AGRVNASAVGRSALPGPSGPKTASASPALARRARVRTGGARNGASLGTAARKSTSDSAPRNTAPLRPAPSIAASKPRTAGRPGLRRASFIPSVKPEGHDRIRAHASHGPGPRRRPSSGPTRTGPFGGRRAFADKGEAPRGSGARPSQSGQDLPRGRAEQLEVRRSTPRLGVETVEGQPILAPQAH